MPDLHEFIVIRRGEVAALIVAAATAGFAACAIVFVVIG